MFFNSSVTRSSSFEGGPGEEIVDYPIKERKKGEEREKEGRKKIIGHSRKREEKR
ncbi:MAG: hypothetical protein LBI70_01815 [Rickettsiales bacterium]|nr:hypothetical protein [Rickettsiales bacterium]